MTQLHSVASASQPLGDIVFVHGLGGHHKTTWMAKPSSEDTFWLAWVATEFQDYNVWSLEYDASPSHWWGSQMDLPDRAINVADLFHQNAIGTRPVVFVAHSLGGLVIKQVLHAAYQPGAAKRVVEISENTRGIAFLATPHKGSGLASKGRWLALLGLRPAHTIENLIYQKPELRHLNKWFRDYFFGPNVASRLHLKVYREAKPTRWVWIVSPDSADPEIASVDCVPVERNHSTICKPNDREDQVHRGVCDFVRRAFGIKGTGKPPNAGVVHRTMLVLDRIDQWDAILKECNDEPGHLAFVIHGARRQSVYLFAERIQKHLQESVVRKHGTPHAVDRRGDGSMAVGNGDWVAHTVAATGAHTVAAKKAHNVPLNVALRRESRDHAASFIYLDRRAPLHAIGADAVEGLTRFLRSDLPSALGVRKTPNPLRFFFPVEDDPGLAKQLHEALLYQDAARQIKVHDILELTFPPWPEVEKYIHSEFGAVQGEFRDACKKCYDAAVAAEHDLETLTTGLREILLVWEEQHG